MKSFLFLLLTVLLISCKKEISELPEATQTGANTFGARVQGKFWKPQGFCVVLTAPVLEGRYIDTNSIIINARNFASSPTESEMEIHLQGVSGPGTYLLNSTTAHYPNQSASYAYYVERRFTPTNEWITNTRYTGTVVLTKVDVANHIISGTFAFEAINLYNTPAPLSVTEGRFDVWTN